MFTSSGFIAATLVSLCTAALSVGVDHGGEDHNPPDILDKALVEDYVVLDVVAGYPTSFRPLDRPADLKKRDCVGNGTNYCFGNNVDFCGSCGSCCSGSGSQYCCAAGAVCCGTACCASGQTCSNGQCLLPVVTVSSTSTVWVTSTQQVGSTVTVVEEVIETSTLVSTTDVSVSTGAQVQTDWVIVTVTATPVKRDIPTALSEQPVNANLARDQDESGLLAADVLAKRDNSLPEKRSKRRSLFQRQQQANAASLEAASTPTSTATVFVTQTTGITQTIPTTVTSQSTLIVVTTVLQTQSIAFGAQTTVTATSTTTWTPEVFTVVVTLTTSASLSTTTPTAATAAAILAATTSSAASAATASGSSLSTTTIAGIAIGVTAIALLVAALLIFFCRQRQRKKETLAREDDDDFYNTGNGYTQPPMSSLPSPTFVPSPTRHGHEFLFQPKAELAAPSAASSLSPTRPYHYRSGSGFTTLTGQATPPGKADHYYSWPHSSGAPTPQRHPSQAGSRTSQAGSRSSVPSSPGGPDDAAAAAAAGAGPAVPPRSLLRGVRGARVRPSSTGLPDGGIIGEDDALDPAELPADDGLSILSDDTVQLARHNRVSYQNVGGQWVAHQPNYRIGPLE